jgi:hypothetical protein
MESASATYVNAWRRTIKDKRKSWALFNNGTCVVLMHPESDLETQAVAILSTWGPVHAGSPAGDFALVDLPPDPGWIVTCHHPDILTYVLPGDIEPGTTDDLAIGLAGRSKRDQDARELKVVHLEDNRDDASYLQPARSATEDNAVVDQAGRDDAGDA